MPFIRIERQAGYVGFFRDILIEVDGVRRARLERNGWAEISVAAGVRSVRARMGDLVSAPLTIAIGDRERVGLVCKASGFRDTRLLLNKAYHAAARERFRVQQAGPQQRDDAIPTVGRDHWSRILGVRPDAGAPEIRAAYLRLMKQCHPDLVSALPHEQQAQAEQRAREINLAYSEAMKFQTGNET